MRSLCKHLLVAVVLPSLVVGCGTSADTTQDLTKAAGPGLQVLSNRSDLVSGGDVLLRVLGNGASSVTVRANGTDFGDGFKRQPDGSFVGLVTGLKEGGNTITAKAGTSTFTTTVVNHLNGGPVFAGPQLQPWVCGNSAATDAQCNQAPEYSYYYKSTNNSGAGLDPYDPENPPADVATTTTESGEAVPFIVRQELGYIDRDQYRIAALFQPDKPWTGAQPQSQFAHKLLVNHGAGCGIQYQTASAPSVIPGGGTSVPITGTPIPFEVPGGNPVTILADATELALGRGYAVMSTALDNAGHHCNVAVQAEALMMVKERVVEQYGALRYTIGEGCSGGSLTIQWVSNAYPGIYQGILPTCSFPDAWGTATQFADYHLLLAYFLDPSKWGQGVAWTEDQMADVMGHVTIANSEVSDNAQFHVAVPTDPCGGVTDEQRYDPDTNPGGVRCSVIDAAINVFGPRPPELWSAQEKQISRGFAGFPVDNVGVQYGLKTLQSGHILARQFMDLNLKIGGLDQDTNPIPSRTPAVEPALTNAYRSGMINEANNLDRTAIIDCRGPDPGAFHDAYRAFATRARLDREHGNHDNQLIWEGPVAILGDNDCARNSFVAMDRWLAAVERDESSLPIAQKLTKNKPADLKDACWDGAGQKVTDGLCPEQVMTIYGTPRTVAGDAITTDTNKCQLKPIDAADYGLVGLMDADLATLKTLFPDGVCDFSKPGVSQQGTIPWQIYQDRKGKVIYGGTAMPPGPEDSGTGWASKAFGGFGGS